MNRSYNLCESFRSLAFRTWDQLAKSRRVGHQPLEETFTDINILELKDRHPHEIYSQLFTKPQEGLNGADWEWWLTDSQRKAWLGLRVQAKILELSSNEFAHLHYKKRKTYQSTKLKKSCAKLGLVPLYCFYSHWPGYEDPSFTPCGSFAHSAESYGCSLVCLKHIESLRKENEVKSLRRVIVEAYPWHCLVCCQGFGNRTLPERAWAFLQGVFEIRPPPRKKADTPIIGLREQPPLYVGRLFEGSVIEAPDPALRGIVLIREAG